MAVSDRLVGSWQLESFTSETKGGSLVHPLGEWPAGLLTYTGEGMMSVHLLAEPGRSETAMDAYTGYFGRFTVNEEEAIVSHQVEGASVEGLAGGVQERHYRFDGDRLELSAVGSRTTLKLTWKRR
ncbi:lipocalin-like domain-containing protein [Novosphingobium pentaromativorans]|uniref:Lipocalin-like domain-containing protein n=1 Tax=Novosphingobium pentaromativorans US6-1 TaxID=1088721 RepID=G6ECJ2_9SPHN|nr:lipocalin-like domain-containing protein [Novosphingobium pentaromativorans]AIT80040.1 hypothetical protein JI59_09770 [Novosphingobium pentaromativorans US6-1]EHJ60903.1 hypothetical protein NSU_2063 [Novosphingobium pentaromativorans US6-1]